MWMSIIPPSQFLLRECSYKISFSFIFSLVFNVISAGKLIGSIDILLSIMSLGKRSALQNSREEYLLSPTGRVRNDLALSVQNVLPALQGILHHALKSICKQAKGVKFQLRCKVLLEKFSFENDNVITIDVWFPAETRAVTVLSQVSSVLNKSAQDMLGKFNAFIHQGLGWVVKEVKVFSLNVNEFTLFSGGGCCSSLPLRIKRSHSYISIGNSCDDRCFLKCVVAALCGNRKNMGQWCREYEKFMKGIQDLSLGFLTFPTTSKVIKKFEQKSPVGINVYGYSGVIYPHYLSSTLLLSDRQAVNLLHSRHYFLIRNERSQNTILLVSTQAVYKALHSTVWGHFAFAIQSAKHSLASGSTVGSLRVTRLEQST